MPFPVFKNAIFFIINYKPTLYNSQEMCMRRLLPNKLWNYLWLQEEKKLWYPEVRIRFWVRWTPRLCKLKAMVSLTQWAWLNHRGRVPRPCAAWFQPQVSTVCCCLTLGKLQNILFPQFSYLWYRGKNSTYSIQLWCRLNDSMRKKSALD